VLYPPFEYEQTTVKVDIKGEVFIAKGKNIKNMGWKEVYQGVFEEENVNDSLAEQSLPDLKKGDTLKVIKLSISQGMTKPPAPFNEGSLLAAMENPVKYMSDDSKALKQTIGETGGLGTVATRADIIEKLFASFLIEKKGKDIFVTAKGKQLLELVPHDLKEPALTAKWEQNLSSIASGKLGKNTFINDIKNYAQAVVSNIKNSQERFRHDNVTRTKCPECGKFLLEVNGKKGKMLICQDRDCGYRKGLSTVTNARCPNCHKKLEMRGEGEGKIFFCACGYREKLTTFQKRKSKENNTKVSKGEVAKYMKEQQKASNEPVNTALADALAKLKLK
jgi:DNA topoisomerase-3